MRLMSRVCFFDLSYLPDFSSEESPTDKHEIMFLLSVFSSLGKILKDYERQKLLKDKTNEHKLRYLLPYGMDFEKLA